MTNQEAYGETTWEQRAATQYQPGQRVYMGPGYVGNGRYAHDEGSGQYYYVYKRCGNSPDYKLAKRPNDSCWLFIVHASRLVAA